MSSTSRCFGLALALLLVLSGGAAQQVTNNIPFTAFGSPAQQRQRQRQQGARLLNSNNLSFPQRPPGFPFNAPQQFQQQRPFTVFRQQPQQFRPPAQTQFGQFRPVVRFPPPSQQQQQQQRQDVFRAQPATTAVPRRPPPQPVTERPRPRPTLFQFVSRPPTTPKPTENPTLRSNEVTLFEPVQAEPRGRFGATPPAPRSTPRPSELPVSQAPLPRRTPFVFFGRPTAPPRTEPSTTETVIDTSDLNGDGGLPDYTDYLEDEVSPDYVYETGNVVASVTDSNLEAHTASSQSDAIESSSGGIVGGSVDFTTDGELSKPTKQQIATARTAASTTPVQETTEPVLVADTEPTEPVPDTTKTTAQSAASDSQLQSIDSAVDLGVVEATAEPEAASTEPPLVDDDFTTAITAPPTNRITRETTPFAPRPTRPSFTRSRSFRDQLRARNQDSDVSGDTAPENTAPTSQPRRLSLRERLRQQLLDQQKEQSTSTSTGNATEPPTAGTSVATRQTLRQTTRSFSSRTTETTPARRRPAATRRPRPARPNSSGGSGGGLASLLLSQLKDEEGAASTTSPPTASSEIEPTTEQIETTRRAPGARRGLAAILAKGPPERSRAGQSLIERLRASVSSTVRPGANRASKELRAGSERQEPVRPSLNRRPSPRFTTTTTTEAVPATNPTGLEVVEDDVSRFLPPGFKPVSESIEEVIIEEDLNPDLLPEGFKQQVREDLESSSRPPKLTPPPRTFAPEVKVEEVEDLSAFLPPGFELESVSTTSDKKQPVIIEDDVSAFLPPGFKPVEQTTTTKRPQSRLPVVVEEDVSAFLPPGYKPPKSTTESSLPIVIEEDVSAFLPPGYKPPAATSKPDLPIAIEEDVSAFLPPGYKPPVTTTEGNRAPAVAVIEQDVLAFLPPGYKQRGPDSTEEKTTNDAPTTKAPRRKGGIVFPGGKDRERKPLDLFLPTPQPDKSQETPGGSTPLPPSAYEIENSKKGLFARLGDRPKFTGWPSPPPKPTAPGEVRTTSPTTPLPTAATTTSTTTTTTTTAVPTTPGVCGSNCRLAGSVRIVSGLRWRPELAVRNTEPWRDAAELVSLELTEAFKASQLDVWFDKIIIDSFSEGSVVADYYLLLNNLVGELTTQDVNVLFQEKLRTSTMELSDGREQKVLQMGSLSIDPGFTDFIVQRPQPVVAKAEANYLIPEWSIAVIVIGLTALLFMLIFGIVLMWNRRKRRARAPRTSVPLTADMLNELDKSHMGGVDNYGVDEVYDPDDAWNNEKVTYDRRLRSASRARNEDTKNYNIYDSWRSDYSGAHGSAAGWSRKKLDNFDDEPGDF